MITIVFRMVIKPDKEKIFNSYLPILKTSSQAKPKSLKYLIYENKHNPKDYILYEQWSDQESLGMHLQRLTSLIGEKGVGSVLPQKLLDCFEDTEDILYKEA